MKRQLSLILALVLSLSLLAAMVACDTGDAPKETTQSATEAPTQAPTNAPTEAPTQAPTEAPTETQEPTETETDAPDDGTTEDVADQPVEGAINIASAEDLIAWANTINEDGMDYMDVTVNFIADIDLAGHNWTPIDGAYLDCVTFEGNGHTIKNLTIEGTDDLYPDAVHSFPYGFAFIQNAEYDLTFRNLNFEGAHITAWERHVGVLVGNVYGNAWLTFENVHVSDINLEGWMDYKNQKEQGGHNIAFRVSGFVGGVFAGELYFENCSVKNAKMTGFHNLAAFVGYDATGKLNADCFTNCHAENLEMTFSYCLSDSYTVDQPKKFVSVFYNAADWVDNIDDFADTGNTYKDIYFIDYTDPDTVHTPADFRSWTYEEAHP